MTPEIPSEVYSQIEQAKATEEAADIAQAHRMRDDLKRAQQAAEGFRKQQHVASMKAEAAERVAESCAAALRVLEVDTPNAVAYNGEAEGPSKVY